MASALCACAFISNNNNNNMVARAEGELGTTFVIAVEEVFSVVSLNRENVFGKVFVGNTWWLL